MVPTRVATRFMPGPPVGLVVDEPTPTTTVVATPTPVPTVPVEEAPSEPRVPEVVAPAASGCSAEIICAYSWDCATAMRVVGCETGGTFYAGAVGNGGERGCFQIHSIHWGKPQCSGNLFDPAHNAACAYSLYADQGWTPWWSCY